jgi:hypothetical protein
MITTPQVERERRCLERGSDHLARLEKIFQKVLKNPLTNTTNCGII